MKIKITHLGSTVKIDEGRNDKTSINYEHEKITGVINQSIRSITDNPPKKEKETNKGKPAWIDELKKEMHFEPEPKIECVNTKTLEPLEIPKHAKECLMMLNQWDEHQMVEYPSGKHIHARVGDSNTMITVKTFLQVLIDNFPKS